MRKLLFCAALSVAGCIASAAAPALPGNDMELAIGDARYPVKVDCPLIVTTPKGETIQLTLLRAATKTYDTPYFSCSVSDVYCGEVSRSDSRVSLLLPGKFRSFALECFPRRVDFDTYVKSFAEGFSKGRESLVFPSAGNDAAVEMGGVRWPGKSFLTRLPDRDAVVSRIYRTEYDGKSYFFVEQFLQSQEHAGGKDLAALCRSFLFHAEK